MPATPSMSQTMKTFMAPRLLRRRFRRDCSATASPRARRSRARARAPGRSRGTRRPRPSTRCHGRRRAQRRTALRRRPSRSSPSRRRIRSVSTGVARAADELGPRAHRGADPRRRARQQRSGAARASSRTSAHRSRRSRRLAVAEQLGDPLLQRMRGVAIRMQRPVVRPARGEHARVLAGAVVAELPVGTALLQAVLEVVDRRTGAREHLAHGRELRGLRAMRRAGDRDLIVVEVVVALDERNRLDRLRRRAQDRTRAPGRPSSRRPSSRRGRGAPPRRRFRASPRRRSPPSQKLSPMEMPETRTPVAAT